MPETLHALIAARLDGLAGDERRLLQAAAVLGKTFTVEALATLSERPRAELEPVLAGLARKEVLSLSADPLSPERGQYGFLQDLVRRVAYEMLSKHERRAKHLAAAAAMDEGEDELAEVVAGHYLAALPGRPRRRRRRRYRPPGGRGAAAGRAAGVRRSRRRSRRSATTSRRRRSPATPLEQADLLEHAGMMARVGGRSDEGRGPLRARGRALRAAGRDPPGGSGLGAAGRGDVGHRAAA